MTDNVGMLILPNLDMPLADALRCMLAASEDEALPYGKASEMERRCLNWCFDRVAIDSGLMLDHVSLKYYSTTASDGEFGEAVVQGGYYQIFQHLVDEVKDSLDIRLGATVTNVVALNPMGQDDAKVVVTCEDGRTFTADSVICTVPVGVLKSEIINFSPRPPQLDFLCDMQMGLMNLVWVWYPHKFWPEGYNFVGVSRAEGTAPTFSTFLTPPMTDQFGNPQAIVMCQTVGQFAQDLESMSDADLAAHATKLLRGIFGDMEVPDAVGCAHSAWLGEKFSAGSYSCPGLVTPSKSVKATNSTEFVTESGHPLMYFAGEATHRMHQGTAHGAYISGIREATKLLLSFGIDEPWDEHCFLMEELDHLEPSSPINEGGIPLYC